MWLGNTLLYTDAALECESLSVWMRGRAELVRQYNTYLYKERFQLPLCILHSILPKFLP